MLIQEFFGGIAFFTSLIGLLPQLWKSYKIKSTKDLSFLMLINYFIGSFSWIIYGIYIDSTFVIYSNIFSTLSSIISIIQKLYYDNK
ncbi:SemiSWEET family sugar transporter [Lyticum sinuosum]|uniref:PQ loop repeat protein n=1 Tax=Lyticum sinuosum TaxID=1332059 RepID=A0AAE5AGV8_9RICK|nr:SemiSWEET family transporter [Lyticum sinuosum]MDZ5760860.1 PQ loop repeat protein [Lyticum sinuosum]